MRLFQTIDGFETGSSERQSRAAAPLMKLKCPKCLAEFQISTCMPFDASVSCIACHAKSELREFHEAWCSGRRALLAANFPDLQWLMRDETLAPLNSEDAIQGDRRASASQATASAEPAACGHIEDDHREEADSGRPARKKTQADRVHGFGG